MRDEMKKSLKSVDDQVKLLNQKVDENNSKMTSVELKNNNILESMRENSRILKKEFPAVKKKFCNPKFKH